MLITQKAYARAGLVGNPSDGYFGKTISFIIRDYWAEVVLDE
jgi:glucuronokinase